MFIETRLFRENSHEKVKRTVLKRCKIVLEQMEKTDYTFLFEMVLMWFDLSTRDGFVSHVVAHVIRRCADNPFSSFLQNVTVQRLCLYVRSSFSSLNIGFIWKMTLEQVSYSIYIPLWFENVIIRQF